MYTKCCKVSLGSFLVIFGVFAGSAKEVRAHSEATRRISAQIDAMIESGNNIIAQRKAEKKRQEQERVAREYYRKLHGFFMQGGLGLWACSNSARVNDRYSLFDPDQKNPFPDSYSKIGVGGNFGIGLHSVTFQKMVFGMYIAADFKTKMRKKETGPEVIRMVRPAMYEDDPEDPISYPTILESETKISPFCVSISGVLGYQPFGDWAVMVEFGACSHKSEVKIFDEESKNLLCRCKSKSYPFFVGMLFENPISENFSVLCGCKYIFNANAKKTTVWNGRNGPALQTKIPLGTYEITVKNKNHGVAFNLDLRYYPRW